MLLQMQEKIETKRLDTITELIMERNKTEQFNNSIKQQRQYKLGSNENHKYNRNICDRLEVSIVITFRISRKF